MAIKPCKCTLFLDSMNQPSQGILIVNNNSCTVIEFPNLDQNIGNLVQSYQIFKGHIPFQKVSYQAKQSLQLSRIVAKHVSAKTLTSRDPPNLLKHCTLNKNNKIIWNKAYEEEYMGIHNLPAWITITDMEYQANKSTYGTVLPTMAISTIKSDQDGHPKREPNIGS